ncbi:hypothetical protein N7462_004602 [Penicillium macrosclerotiorum]|uniref:uncharacterized protein n=1 Tax=Penicillium macrosclerotiorum TaxID=303699 RepID=UPI002547EDA6|nr:uncharacterized protein N7462_004602 [Penicillium macrosclerotiorum]KAJ5690210.1 hypothetical protein N7462_004602 [Penicillium macrosclerotiorum]
MPYLATSQAFLEQSAMLLQAYPETTRITTKYSFPTARPSARAKHAKSLAKKPSTTADTTPPTPIAALTLKTYNPATGIVLQYRTNKIAEVSRLVTGLGKLAAGADVASLGAPAPGAADVEMVDAPAVEESAAAPVSASGGKAGGGAKGKKKGGKGKR